MNKQTRKQRRVSVASVPTHLSDMGTGTPAARRNTIVEEAVTISLSGQKIRDRTRPCRIRRLTLFEHRYNNGNLEKRLFLAAQAYRNAYDNVQQMSPTIPEIRVDAESRDSMEMRLARRETLNRFERAIPNQCREVVDQYVLHDVALRNIRGSRRGLRSNLLLTGLTSIAKCC